MVFMLTHLVFMNLGSKTDGKIAVRQFHVVPMIWFETPGLSTRCDLQFLDLPVFTTAIS